MLRIMMVTGAVALGALAPAVAVADTPNQGGYGSTPVVIPPTGATGQQGGGAPQQPENSNGTAPGAGNGVAGTGAGGSTTVLGGRASSPSGSGSPASGVSPATASSAPVATPSASRPAGGALAFTGLDVGVIALVALVLGGVGLALRRATREERAGNPA